MTARLNWNILAQAASFGDVSVEDIAPSPSTVARASKSLRVRQISARRSINALARSINALVAAGLLVEVYGDRFEPTTEGLAALKQRGYVRHHNGAWLRDGARTPSWA